MTTLFITVLWFFTLIVMVPLLVLKLFGVIKWSWLIILAPVYVPVFAAIGVFLFLVVPFLGLVFLLALL